MNRFIAIIYFASCLVACGGSGPNDDVVQDVPIPIGVDLGEPATAEPYAETTIDKIEAAYLAGRLTGEERVRLEMSALHGLDTVPEEFVGAEDVAPDHGALSFRMFMGFGSFSEATQALLRPYTLSPKDPQSAFAPPMPPPESRVEFWQEIAATPNVTVTYPLAANAQIAANANLVALAAGAAESKFADLFQITPPRVNIFVLPIRPFKNETGYAYMMTDTLCFVGVRDDLDANETSATTVHELFHCFEFQVLSGMDYKTPDLEWLMESSATWSEHFIFPSINSEQSSLSAFLLHTNWDLLDVRGTHHYGAYLWPLYLDQTVGAGNIALIHYQARWSVESPRLVLMKRPGFLEEHKEFVAWNWNRDPLNKYRDDPVFPAVGPNGESRKDLRIKTVGSQKIEVSLSRGAAMYHAVYLDNPKLHRIEFDLTGMGIDSTNFKAVQAALRLGDGKVFEDWSGRQKVVFCRDLESQNFGGGVLIVSNADLEAPAFGSITVKAEEKCGPGWRGSIRIDWNFAKEWSGSNGMTTGYNRVRDNGQMVIREELAYNATDDALEVANIDFVARWSSYTSFAVSHADDTCLGFPLVWQDDSTRCIASNAYDYKDKISDVDNVRLRGSGSAGKLEGSYSLNFSVPTPPTGSSEDIYKCSSLFCELRRDCASVGGIPNQGGFYQEPSSSTSPNFAVLPNAMDVEILANDKIIKGSFTYDDSGGYEPYLVTVSWDYLRLER